MGKQKIRRREFLASLTGTALASAGIETTRANQTENTIDITIYADRAVWEELTVSSTQSDFHELPVSNTAFQLSRQLSGFPSLELGLSDWSRNNQDPLVQNRRENMLQRQSPIKTVRQSIQYAFKNMGAKVDVTIAPVPVEWNPDTDDAEEQVYLWRDVLYDNTKYARYSSNDSNVLLTESTAVIDDDNEVMGIGTIACEVCQGTDVSIVFDVNKLARDNVDSIEALRTTEGTEEILSVAIHEIGHNLGLDHDHGAVLSNTQNEVVTTPMLHTYVKDPDYLQENRYGEEIEHAAVSQTVYTHPQFNPSISMDSLFIE